MCGVSLLLNGELTVSCRFWLDVRLSLPKARLQQFAAALSLPPKDDPGLQYNSIASGTWS